jgi:hypothetical protein
MHKTNHCGHQAVEAGTFGLNLALLNDDIMVLEANSHA